MLAIIILAILLFVIVIIQQVQLKSLENRSCATFQMIEKILNGKG